VLETGEFIRVGSSKVIKTDVRVVAATNLDIHQAIRKGKFREDLFYRLNTVPIQVPPLKERGKDILLLFRKFAADFSERYRMPPIRLDEEAKQLMLQYQWPGNVRQLKNITEQLSIIEQEREITGAALMHYLPDYQKVRLPALIHKEGVSEDAFNSEREILYKVLFDMRSDMNDLKKLVAQIMERNALGSEMEEEHEGIIKKLYSAVDDMTDQAEQLISSQPAGRNSRDEGRILDTEEILEESLSLAEKEKELICKALGRHNGKRKHAAHDLGISERTLYRKIKEYDIE
jgi:DNA-binding NtrC family response regulator